MKEGIPDSPTPNPRSLIFLEFYNIKDAEPAFVEASNIDYIGPGWIREGKSRYALVLKSGKGIEILESPDEVRSILRSAGML